MPIHGRIISQAITKGGPIVAGVLKSDKMALNYAWKGYRHKGRIVQALRGSLVTGSVIGGLVQDPDGGSIPFFNETNKSYKARGRSTNKRARKCVPVKHFSKYRRRSNIRY